MALGGGLLGGLEGRNVLTGQEALYQASWEISAARDPQAVLNAIHDYLDGPATAGVALLQPPGRPEDDSPNGAGAPETRKPWFSRDWPDGVGFDGLDVPGLAGVDGGRPRTLRAEDLPARERAAWKGQGIRSAFLLPLVTPGSARVWLLVVASGKRRLPKSTVRACFTVGAQAALVLENLWLVEEARRAGVLRERQRMAHEIHDTLAQGFTSIVMNLEAAEGIMPPTSDRARHHLDQARLTARESLTEARRLVWALRPEALERASLPEALNRLAERWSKESDVAADVTVTGTPRSLSPDIEATLFRTAQEALANVRKHANASRVALTLSYMGDALALDVRDDGVGFDPSRTATEARDRTSGGFGLKGMRERIEQAGGSLSVESAPGEGSTLAVELPMIAPEGTSPESGGPEPLRVEPAGRVP
ncbi:MAG: sensor histidine kinase [Actinomycetota bacterium]|nr:sensor histidine kinase [Actinomycetota bacterium]